MSHKPNFRPVDFLKLARKVGAKDAGLFYGQHLLGQTPAHAGIHLRPGSSDLEVFKQIFVWEEYAYPVKGEVRTIIDAGANIGCSSVWFARKYPSAKLIALEPEQSNFEALVKNTARYPQIHPVKKGLWNKSCSLKIESSSADNWAFRVLETTADDPEAIPATSIADLVREHGIGRIDILKIDIETSEKHVFDASARSWLPLTKYLFIETHDFMEKGCAKAVTEAVFEFDFDMYTLGENLVFVNNKL